MMTTGGKEIDDRITIFGVNNSF